MNTPIENETKKFYEQIVLPEQKVEAILDSGHYASIALRWQRIAIASLVGLAAMTLLSINLFLSKNNSAQMVNRTPEKPFKATPAGFPPENKTSQKAIIPQYRLVSFRSHDHGCPHCRKTKEVFDELEKAMKNTPLHFVDFKLNQKDSQEAVEQYELQPLVEGLNETAFIALTTFEGKKIAQFKPTLGTTQIQQQIQAILKK